MCREGTGARVYRGGEIVVMAMHFRRMISFTEFLFLHLHLEFLYVSKIKHKSGIRGRTSRTCDEEELGAD